MKKVRFEKEMVTPKTIYFVEGTNSNLSDYLANLLILKLDERSKPKTVQYGHLNNNYFK